jgi:hypothetical protein
MLRLMRWGDDEKQQHQRVLEPEREELDDYPSGPHKLTVLSKYRVHVARMAVDEMVRHYTYYCEIVMIVNYC